MASLGGISPGPRLSRRTGQGQRRPGLPAMCSPFLLWIAWHTDALVGPSGQLRKRTLGPTDEPR